LLVLVFAVACGSDSDPMGSDEGCTDYSVALCNRAAECTGEPPGPCFGAAVSECCAQFGCVPGDDAFTTGELAACESALATAACRGESVDIPAACSPFH